MENIDKVSYNNAPHNNLFDVSKMEQRTFTAHTLMCKTSVSENF